MSTYNFPTASKHCLPQWRGETRAVENWSTALRGMSAEVVFLSTFFFFSYTILTSTEPGASEVKDLVSPRY